MNQNTKNQGKDAPNKGTRVDFDKDQPNEVAGQPIHDRSEADDKGQGLRRKPESEPAAIPELDEPNVESGNEEGKHTEATMPPGQGTDPKRNTM
jgi:hypothetical protein